VTGRESNAEPPKAVQRSVHHSVFNWTCLPLLVRAFCGS